MSSADEIDLVVSVKLLHYVSSKQVPSSSRRHTPASDFIRITPHEVTHGAIVRYFLLSVKITYVIKSVDGRRKTPMNAEDLIIDYCCKSQVVENVSAVSPYIDTTVLP